MNDIKVESEHYKIHYDLADAANNIVAPIELLTGRYKGVIYHYGKSEIQKVDENNGKLLFEFNIIDYAGHKQKKLDKSSEFVKHIGDILNEIMLTYHEKDLSVEKVERPIIKEDEYDFE